MKYFKLIIIAILTVPSLVIGQGEDVGNWLMYFGTNKISDKLSVHSELQYRNHTVVPNNIEQLLIRTGLNYHLKKSTILTAGYGFIASYDFESPMKAAESTEHRVFQQLIMINKVKRVKFEHRYRIEQRWVNSDYKNRLRYRLMAFIPLNNKEFVPGTFFIGLYDEVFMNTKSTFFDRNRLYAALGYQVSKPLQVQLGYLRQTLNSGWKNYLQLGVVFNTDFRSSVEN